MIRWTRSMLPLAALVLGACTPPPDEVSTTTDGSSSTGTSAGPTTTPPPTTMPGDDTVGTQGATGTDTTMGTVDTTVGVSVTDDGTTTSGGMTTGSSESSSSGPPPRPECDGVEDCELYETCSPMGECVALCAAWGDGSYDYCLDQYGTVDIDGLCGAGHVCATGGDPIEAATCADQGCTSICDCPGPPATGTAVVTCDLLTVGDMVTDCYLSCANGETCPDGMVCRVGVNDTYCAQPVQPLAMYGNCDDIAAPCIVGECAVANGAMGQSWSVCVGVCDGGIVQCDPAPPGADLGVGCDGIIFPPNGADCHLDCFNSDDCPLGMVCIDLGDDNMCMWP